MRIADSHGIFHSLAHAQCWFHRNALFCGRRATDTQHLPTWHCSSVSHFKHGAKVRGGGGVYVERIMSHQHLLWPSPKLTSRVEPPSPSCGSEASRRKETCTHRRGIAPSPLPRSLRKALICSVSTDSLALGVSFYETPVTCISGSLTSHAVLKVSQCWACCRIHFFFRARYVFTVCIRHNLSINSSVNDTLSLPLSGIFAQSSMNTYMYVFVSKPG